MKQQQNNRPTYAVYVVEGEGESAFWTKIGAAWPQKDENGFSITLTALPVNNRLVLRKPKPADQETAR